MRAALRRMPQRRRPHAVDTNAHTLSALPRASHSRVCSTTRSRATADDAGLSLLASSALGGFSGVASGLTGTGGGIILIPALAKLTNMTQQTINGTQHGAITFSALIGASNHLDAGACNIPLAVVATVPSILCARVGVKIAQKISSQRLSLAVGVAMLATAPVVLVKDSSRLPKLRVDVDPADLQRYRHTSDNKFLNDNMSDPLRFARVNMQYAIVGGLAGFISGLVGVGGGVLVTAYLTAATDMAQESIIGTSLLSIVPTSASAAYTGFRAKAIHVPTAVRLGGSLGLGVYLTSKYVTHEVPEDILRGILATAVGGAALVMMRRGL